MAKPRLLVLTAALAIAAVAAAQTDPLEPLIKITVGVVQVDAVVTDSKGKPVRDLKAEDFVVFQDGEQKPITNFSFVATSSRTTGQQRFGPGARAAKLDRLSIRRTIAIVVDDLGMSLYGVNQVRHRLRKFIDEQVGEDDLVSIVRTSASTGSLRGFTVDKRRLHAALDEIWWRPGFHSGTLPPGLVVQARLDMDRRLATRPGPTRIYDSGISSPERRFEEGLFAGSIGALQHTIRGMRELPGRKATLYFSESSFLFIPDRTGNRRTSTIGRLDNVRTEMFRKIIDEANRAGVVIYGVDPRGVGGGLDPIETTSFSFGAAQDGLQFLADQTGGLYLGNSNDIAGLVGRAMDDMQGYYLLGYSPDSETFDRKFHRIEVKLTKPGLKIRSRRGFFGYEDKDRVLGPPATRAGQLLQALDSPFGADDIEVRVNAVFAFDQQGKPAIQSLTRIDASGLEFVENQEGLLEVRLDVLTAAFDISGQVLDNLDQEYVATVSPDQLAQVRETGLLYTSLHPLKKPGGYQFRVAVRDQHTQRLGSGSQFVDAPLFNKKKRLGMSGIVMGAASHIGQSDAEPHPQGSPALRTFKAGERVYYWRQIFNAKADKGTGERKLVTHSRLYREGELVQDNQPFPFEPTKALAGGLIEDIRLYDLAADLAPGRYALEVETRDMLADPEKGSARGWVDFQIVER